MDVDAVLNVSQNPRQPEHLNMFATPQRQHRVTLVEPTHKHGLLSPVLQRIRSTRLRSKSTSESTNNDSVNNSSTRDESPPANKGILKRLLLKRHRAKRQTLVNSNSLDESSSSTQPAVPPPSVALLEGILPPNSEYYVTVSGGDRSKLLTFHPKLDNAPVDPPYPRLSTLFENATGGPSNAAGESDPTAYNPSDVLCAKISNLTLSKNPNLIAVNERLEAVSKSKYFVSALNSERDISNLSHVPISGGKGLPGLTRFIYKAPPLGASVDIGVNEEILKVFDDQEIYSQFMKSHTSFHILPKSSKLIVFDSNLKIKKAFQALIYNGVRAAVVWDSTEKCYVGMITVTDFIMRMRSYSSLHDSEMIKEFENDTISTWRSRLDASKLPLISIAPTDSLYEAAKRLSESCVHRVLVVDPVSGDAMSIITHKRLLRFLYLYIYELARPFYLSMEIGELGVGTFDKIYTVTPNDSIYRALDIFVEHQVSAVPVVDENSGVLMDVYNKFDVIYLIKCHKAFSQSEIRVSDGLSARDQAEDYHTFKVTDSLLTVVERLVDLEAHRLICVDDDGKVRGIISLSDILCFLVLRAPRRVKDRSLQSNLQGSC